MEGTGFSMFHGPSLHINNSAEDRLVEQEELEDQKRRKEELRKDLHNAFDDLQDDDDSMNNSANFTTDYHNKDESRHKLPLYKEHQSSNTPKMVCEQNHNYYSPSGAGDGQNYCHYNGVNMQLLDKRQDPNLEVMYKMRVEEFQTLAMENENLKTQYDKELTVLRSRLSASVTDKEKTELSLQQAQHLLTQSKVKICELEQQMLCLENKILMSNEEKEQIKLELQSCTIQLQETQHRLKSTQVAQVHKTDSLFREQQDRHREELDRLTDDLLKTKSRLEEKERETNSLEMRCKQRDMQHENLLHEKNATIHKLKSELEAAQSQVASGDNAKLKEKLSLLTATSQKQIKELGAKLELTAHDLVLQRDKNVGLEKEYKDYRSKLQQIMQESHPDTLMGEPSTPGKLSTLKDILTRYQQQLQKFAPLQDEISKRDKKLEVSRKQETELRSELDELKTEKMKLKTNIGMLENKLELLHSSNDSELLESYKKQNKQLQEQIDELRSEHKSLDLKYTELEMRHEGLKNERKSLVSKEQDINADLLKEYTQQNTQFKKILEENNKLKEYYLKSRIDHKATEDKLKHLEMEKSSIVSKEKEYQVLLDKEKQMVAKLNAQLASEKEEGEKANMRISELQKEFSEKQKVFNDKLNKFIEEERSAARKEMEICTQCEMHMRTIKNLKDQLNECQLQLAKLDSNVELINELKVKADFFKNYVEEKCSKLAQLHSVATNTDPFDMEQPTVGVTPEVNGVHDNNQREDLSTKTNMMMKEKEIRDHIAEKYTIEIKTIEMKSAKKLKEMENEHLCNVNKLKQLLERKVDEVETLKQFILSERTKITEILQAKESEVSMLIKENNSLQSEFQVFRDKATELKCTLEKAQAKISKLKVELEKKCQELESSKKYLSSQSEWQQKCKMAETKYAQIDAQHQLLKEKYKSVKKTALTYKEYAAKKDVHVESELERITTHYKEIINGLQTQIQQLVNKRQQAEVTERINKIQSNFNAMMSDNNRQL